MVDKSELTGLDTDEGIEDQFDELDEDDTYHARLYEMIDYIHEDRFPFYDDEVSKIVARADARHGLSPIAPGVALAVRKQLGSDLEVEVLEGLSDEELDRFRPAFIEGTEEVILEAIGTWAQRAVEFNSFLIELETSEIQKLFHEAQAREIEDDTKFHGELDALSFFNEPRALADFDYWGGFPAWTLDEATALSFDRDPEKVNQSTLHEYRETAAHSPFVKEYMRRTHLIRRAIETEALRSHPSPREFADWAKKAGIALGSNFGRWANVTHENHDAEDEYFDPRSRTTLSSVLIGVLVAKYGLSPTFHTELPLRTNAFFELSSDLSKAGVGVSERTLRNQARAALSFVPNLKKPRGK